jgi:6-phosphogluconate dehydrogenase (decarboxylating)
VRAAPPFADIVICLPATLIAACRADSRRAHRHRWGGLQRAVSGAFTGDLSAEMLKCAGAGAVIVGHSERRQHHGETDAIVAAKAEAARRAGLADKLKKPRAVWMMVPTPVVDTTLKTLILLLDRDDVIVDGGNSYYHDALRRAAELKPTGIHYVDVGTSGGIW